MLRFQFCPSRKRERLCVPSTHVNLEPSGCCEKLGIQIRAWHLSLQQMTEATKKVQRKGESLGAISLLSPVLCRIKGEWLCSLQTRISSLCQSAVSDRYSAHSLFKLVVLTLDAYQNHWGMLKTADGWVLSPEILMKSVWSETQKGLFILPRKF